MYSAHQMMLVSRKTYQVHDWGVIGARAFFHEPSLFVGITKANWMRSRHLRKQIN